MAGGGVLGVFDRPVGRGAQEHYLNAVLLVDDPAAGARDWLLRGQELERAAGRVREVRWGARTLDVDVVWCAEHRPEGLRVCRSADPTLTLPHPQAHNRAFVLLPWAEVEPDAVLDVLGRPTPVRELLAALDPAEREGVRLTELTLRAAS